MSDETVAIPLGIQEELAQRGLKGKMSLIVEGMPVGASLSAGTNNWDNTWSLTVAEVNDLHFIPSPETDGIHTLSVRVLRFDSDGYDVAATAALVDLKVDCSGQHQAKIAEAQDTEARIAALEESLRAEAEQNLAHAEADWKAAEESRLTQAKADWQAQSDKALRNENIEFAKQLKKDGRTYRQIAERLGIGLGTAHDWVNSAKSKPDYFIDNRR